MTTTVTMLAPGSSYTSVTGQSGAIYYSDANGLVANVAAGDIAALQGAGFTIVGAGFGAFHIPLLSGKNLDGSALGAAASSGKFGNAITLGTSSKLVSQAANAGTITDTVVFDVVLPSSFKSGASPTIVANGNHVIGSGVLGAHTLAIHAYSVNDDGTQGADIVTTAAQNTTPAAGDIAFNTNTAALLASGRVMVSAVVNIVETATHDVTFNLNSLRFT